MTAYKTPRSELLCELLEFGRSMLLCGADIRYIELTLEQVGRAFGLSEMSVFVITSVIIITAQNDEGEERTQTIRINEKVATNFTKLEAYSDLAHKMVASPMSVRQFSAQRKRIDETSQTRFIAYAGAVLAAGGFAIFFGGQVADGVIAALIGIIFCFMQRHIRPYCPNDIVFNFIGCFVAGLLINFVCRLLPQLTPAMITIGVIMLPIPGIPITNSVRDMLSGDTMTGILRFVESLLITCGIAGGFVASMALVGA